MIVNKAFILGSLSPAMKLPCGNHHIMTDFHSDLW